VDLVHRREVAPTEDSNAILDPRVEWIVGGRCRRGARSDGDLRNPIGVQVVDPGDALGEVILVTIEAADVPPRMLRNHDADR
jgi:hypothetical protein